MTWLKSHYEELAAGLVIAVVLGGITLATFKDRRNPHQLRGDLDELAERVQRLEERK